MKNSYTFEKDALNWVLVKTTVAGEDAKTPGKIVKRTIGYFGKLEIAALRMQENLQRDLCPDEPTLQEIRDAIPVATQAVIAAVRALEGGAA